VARFVAVLALASCSTQPPRDGTTYDKIKAELKDAAENRTAGEQKQGVLQSLLPTLDSSAERRGARGRATLRSGSDERARAAGAGRDVAGTRYSMVVHPDIKTSMSLNLKKVTIGDVLNGIREIYGFEYKIDGTRIYVMPPTLQTRMFKVDYLTSLRRGSTDLRISSNNVSTTGTTQTGVVAPAAAPAPAAGGGIQQPGVLPSGLQPVWSRGRAPRSEPPMRMISGGSCARPWPR
jgi:MSHA biogenesis protein MshL